MELNIKSGFITNEGKEIEIPYKEMGDFCQSFCLNYASKSDKNKKELEDFSHIYNTYNPYYDFIIHRLGWIHIGVLNDPKKIAFGIKNKLIIKYGKDVNVDDVKKEEKYIKELEENYGKHSDYEAFSIGNCGMILKYEGFLMPNGKMIKLENGLHEDAGLDVLQNLCFTYPQILSDYDYYKRTANLLLTKDYLISRLGMIKIAAEELRNGDMIYTYMYDPYLMNDIKSRMLKMSFARLENVHDYQASFSDTFDDYNIDEAIRLIDLYMGESSWQK